MPSKNARRGSNFERELVNLARAAGLRSVRAYASDGRSLGEDTTVDLTIGKLRVQAKRRKKLASYLQIPAGADAVAFRQDRGPTLILLPYEALLDLVKQQTE